jgi:Putative MetA-pathway of phenol degradation
MHATLRLGWLIAVAVLTAPANASAQERPLPLADVLSFLLTNQSVPTGDFVKDAQAAAVTRDTITRLLLVELTTVPLGSSSAGFTYRVNPALGTIERASQSFGPFFVERSLTAGRGRASIGVNLQFANYTRLNDVDLENGEFVATGNQFRDEAAPFDVETLSMEIQSRTLTVLGNVGVTNRLDVGVAVPVVWLSLEGSRVNTYRGAVLLQATASAEATGLGDMAIRAKYRLAGDRGTGLAIVGEARLPTGRKEDLLGSGEASYTAVMVGSVEPGRLSAHVNAGATWGGLVNEVGYRGALSFSASPRVTLLAELLGRRIEDIGELTRERVPHPTIAGVDTIRLVSTGTTLTTSAMTAGARWNVVGTWLLNASVTFPLANHGLRSETTTLVGIEYAFGGQ